MNDNSHESSANKNQAISKHVLALTTFLALVPLVYFIPDFVEQFLPPIKWLNVVVVVGIIVPIISYGIMPIVSLALSR